MEQNFERQVLEIFGTTDIRKLRKISEKAAAFDCRTKERHPGGRKNLFTDENRAQILALQESGTGIAEIARKYKVSRQTIYNQIRRAHCFSDSPQIQMRMNYMNQMALCTTIDIDFQNEKIKIRNYTDKIPLRAFGIKENPSWADFQLFLEDRCFPRTRDHAKVILKEMGIPFYDPLLIIEKTKGRMAGDHQWIVIVKREG